MENCISLAFIWVINLKFENLDFPSLTNTGPGGNNIWDHIWGQFNNYHLGPESRKLNPDPDPDLDLSILS